MQKFVVINVDTLLYIFKIVYSHDHMAMMTLEYIALVLVKLYPGFSAVMLL